MLGTYTHSCSRDCGTLNDLHLALLAVGLSGTCIPHEVSPSVVTLACPLLSSRSICSTLDTVASARICD